MGWAVGGEVFRGGEGDGRVGRGNCMVWRLWDGIWVEREESSGDHSSCAFGEWLRY